MKTTTFTADTAELLWARCMRANAGIRIGAQFNVRAWNYDDYYRVIVWTVIEETEIEYYKAFGTWKLFREGELLSEAEFN